jgi:hypothetical protein
MDQKQLDALMSNISAATDKLHEPIKALALVKMIDVFYAPEQRTALLQQIDDAYAASSVAYEAMTADTRPEQGRTEEQKAEHRRLFDAKLACDRVVDGLKKEHKLLFRLREAKEALSKGKYDFM